VFGDEAKKVSVVSFVRVDKLYLKFFGKFVYMWVGLCLSCWKIGGKIEIKTDRRVHWRGKSILFIQKIIQQFFCTRNPASPYFNYSLVLKNVGRGGGHHATRIAFSHCVSLSFFVSYPFFLSVKPEIRAVPFRGIGFARFRIMIITYLHFQVCFQARFFAPFFCQSRAPLNGWFI
jgi:hypothetical protein